ncbi:Putative nucleotidyltransferase substrate binding domain protein [Vibrio aerogenes CECT 7868]|uniref:Putative nucleotidyltransferase substrate binding domain protein n=1 Tax=Vibrio aerogenes CECT 7868 TaxID=1216006 RepID=A0A1M5YSK6_9VIBR|nr:DUF294 nucleotidyltransferase-like domain-containing protein [Vibrio aerogenes]SHI14850.1 Putative nucleotidyltransferase substrate binding domain protein [Vibrio aerogenes CECT 7868]
MSDKFNLRSPPFNRLTSAQQQSLLAALDIAYYRAGDEVLRSHQPGEFLFILMKGMVEERSADGQEVYAHYTHDDIFDVRAILNGTTKHHYTALEDTLTYLLPKSVFLTLYQQNGTFAAYFDNNLATRQSLIETAKKQQNLAEFILTRVDSTIYQPPVILAPEQSIQDATFCLEQHHYDAALVRLTAHDPRLSQSPDAPPYAIITRTNLLHALTINGCSLSTPAAAVATFPVHSIHDGDFLFNAMLQMIRHKIKRIVICQGEEAVGILDMIQVMSIFSTHSHVLTLSIDRADSIEELRIASHQQHKLIKNLVAQGIRTRFIMALIATVNEQIIEKAFQLVVPPAMHQHCCLLVLGSEGRSEQILKTDQDNALILEDDIQWDECEAVMETLSRTLVHLGYPHCPGKVMVNNSFWVRTQTGWRDALTQWVMQEKPEQIMQLAIFSDAHAVAGNKALLTPVQDHLTHLMENQEVILARFTRPALNFSSPLTLFGNVKSSKSGLDIKQGGIFPIVHGIRALSLEHGITEKNTFERIQKLVSQRVLEQQTADNLTEALKLFFKFRLQQQLEYDHTGNLLHVDGFERTERDLLRHSLHIVKKFKQWLAYHYQIRD